MSRDHIIPRFILRGFAISPTKSKSKQRIMIYNKETRLVITEKIDDAYALPNFNSPDTEQYLANEYESKVARLFQRIAGAANTNQPCASFSTDEYNLLFRFFVIMWRRNDIHLERTREMALQFEGYFKSIFGSHYKAMLNPEYKDYTIEKIFNEKIDDIRTVLYDKLIRETTDDDTTVLKTIMNYHPVIIENKSKIHFLLHNTYSTLVYAVSKNQTDINTEDMPGFMICPISKTLCFCLLPGKNETSLSKGHTKIPIEIWDNDEDIKRHFIDGYITKTAKSFVVDETNMDFVQALTY